MPKSFGKYLIYMAVNIWAIDMAFILGWYDLVIFLIALLVISPFFYIGGLFTVLMYRSIRAEQAEKRAKRLEQFKRLEEKPGGSQGNTGKV